MGRVARDLEGRRPVVGPAERLDRARPDLARPDLARPVRDRKPEDPGLMVPVDPDPG